jgi:hypothetical protein
MVEASSSSNPVGAVQGEKKAVATGTAVSTGTGNRTGSTETLIPAPSQTIQSNNLNPEIGQSTNPETKLQSSNVNQETDQPEHCHPLNTLTVQNKTDTPNINNTSSSTNSNQAAAAGESEAVSNTGGDASEAFESRFEIRVSAGLAGDEVVLTEEDFAQVDEDFARELQDAKDEYKDLRKHSKRVRERRQFDDGDSDSDRDWDSISSFSSDEEIESQASDESLDGVADEAEDPEGDDPELDGTSQVTTTAYVASNAVSDFATTDSASIAATDGISQLAAPTAASHEAVAQYFPDAEDERDLIYALVPARYSGACMGDNHEGGAVSESVIDENDFGINPGTTSISQAPSTDEIVLRAAIIRICPRALVEVAWKKMEERDAANSKPRTTAEMAIPIADTNTDGDPKFTEERGAYRLFYDRQADFIQSFL